MNALVAETTEQAWRIIQGLRLPPLSTVPLGYGESLSGRLFNHVVIFPPKDGEYRPHEKMWLDDVLPCHVKSFYFC